LEKKKVLVYVQKIHTKKKPSSSYLHTIIKGYKDCNLNINALKKQLKSIVLIILLNGDAKVIK